MKWTVKEEHAKAHVVMLGDLAVPIHGGQIDTKDILRLAKERLPIEEGEDDDVATTDASGDDGGGE
jgi:hypothetical protein